MTTINQINRIISNAMNSSISHSDREFTSLFFSDIIYSIKMFINYCSENPFILALITLTFVVSLTITIKSINHKNVKNV